VEYIAVIVRRKNSQKKFPERLKVAVRVVQAVAIIVVDNGKHDQCKTIVKLRLIKG